MFRVALKNTLAHKFRSLALVLCVILGVSFVTGTYVLTDTMAKVFDDIFTEAHEGIDLSVRSQSELGIDTARPPVPEGLVTTVRSVEGVALAEGAVFGLGAEIIDANGRRVGNEWAPSFGGSWGEDDQLSPLFLREGRKPSGPTEVALDARSFADGGFSVVDPVRIVTPTGSRVFTVVGVAGFGEATNLAGATFSVFDLPTAQEVMNRSGQFDSIDLRIVADASPETVAEQVSRVLPEGYEVVTAAALVEESTDAVEEGLAFFRTFLLVFAFIALFVGAFIIYNTFGVVVAQRTRELALLRAVGASRGQITASVIGESAVLGGIASVLGLVAGLGIAAGLKAMLAGFGMEVPSGQLVLLARTVIVALVGGMAITVVSAISPAIRAARVPPVVALGESGASQRAATVRRNLAGLGLLVAGVVLVGVGLGGGSLSAVGAGALGSFVGVSMLAPMLARPVARLVGSPIARTRGAAGILARQNAVRSARRTAATASALMVGTALMAGALVLSSSLSSSVERAISGGLVADLVVHSRTELGFSPAVADEVSEVPGVAHAHRVRIGRFKVGDSTKVLTAASPESLDPRGPGAVLDIDVRAGDIAALGEDGIAVSSGAARQHRWSVGDMVAVTFPSGVQHLRVVAEYEERYLSRDYMIATTTFDRHFAELTDYLLLVNVTPGVDAQMVQSEIQGIVDTSFPGLRVQDRDQFLSDQKAIINQVLGLITALLALAVLIALIGVLITMLLAVFERTRELGLLRAVGMARRQVRSMVRWEAAIIAAYGALLGLGLGVAFGLAVTRALADQGVTNQVVPALSLAVLAVVIGLLAVVAAAYPARRAARLDVLTAIAGR